ncbi:MAG: glycosyltransferase family 2 protein [Acidimicrobiales bacterium]
MATPEVSPGARARRPAASVVLCTKDRPHLAPAALASVRADLGLDDEMIVVEDGDSGVVAVLADWAHFDRVQHHRAPATLKTAKMNSALRSAGGEVVLFTDDDCQVPSGWIDAMCAPFATDANLGIAFGPVRGLTHVPGGEPPPSIAPGPAPLENWNFAHGASMAVRRSAALAVGGFDQRLGPGSWAGCGEEPDMIVRMAKAGWSCAVADAPVMGHVEWRDGEQVMANLLTYEKGSGYWLGAGMRRDPMVVAKLLVLRLIYQAALMRHRDQRGWWFGPRCLLAFITGLTRGILAPPRRWT